MIGNSVEWGNLRPWQRMISGYQTAGIKLIIIEVTFEDFLNQPTKDMESSSTIGRMIKNMSYQKHICPLCLDVQLFYLPPKV